MLSLSFCFLDFTIKRVISSKSGTKNKLLMFSKIYWKGYGPVCYIRYKIR